eukprot:1141280-Pyramimonas_sp.AAC.1
MDSDCASPRPAPRDYTDIPRAVSPLLDPYALSKETALFCAVGLWHIWAVRANAPFIMSVFVVCSGTRSLLSFVGCPIASDLPVALYDILWL